MKRRNIFLIMAYGLLIINITGCWSSRELNDLAIVMGIGIDKSDQPQEVKVTAQFANISAIKSSQKEKSSTLSSYINVNSTGKTVFDAIRGLNQEVGRRVYLPHNQLILFSKDIAESGIKDYIDFFLGMIPHD